MAYKTINLWCKTTKYGSLAETIADDLIKHILQDITPFEAEVTLKVCSYKMINELVILLLNENIDR